jgi:large subunit ribosomal protein L25
VVYGPKQDALSISISLSELEAALRHGGESSMIELAGLEKPLQTLIHDLDRNPVTNKPQHVDFYAVEKGAKVQVAVPIAFVGESAAVKAGAALVKVMHEIEVECAPDKLPQEIEVDIEALAAEGDQILASSVKAPAGVEILTDGEEVVALAQAVKEEAEDESAAPDMDAIEVEQKGKSEDSEEEAG